MIIENTSCYTSKDEFKIKKAMNIYKVNKIGCNNKSVLFFDYFIEEREA